MAGYFIYSLDGSAFEQLTTEPTDKQTLALADVLLEDFDRTIGKLKKKEQARWPSDRTALAAAVGKRLVSTDWYSDLSLAEAEIWDAVPLSLRGKPGKAVGIGFEVCKYGSVYWDCAEMAVEFGASSMAEPTFGNSGFRYFGKPASEDEYGPPILIYSIFPNERTKALLAELEAVAPDFEALANGEGTPREQFSKGLLPYVRSVADKGRALFVQTDT